MIPNDLRSDGPNDLQGIEQSLRAEELAKKFATSFVADVLKQAGQQIIVKDFDRDAVVDARNALWVEGFRESEPDSDEPDMSIYTTPKLLYEFRDSIAVEMQLDMSNEPNSTIFHRMAIYGDASIPDETAIAVHHDAIAPPTQFSAKRPWIIKHPKGVVEIQING